MKDKKYSPYATNKGGKITAPKSTTGDNVRAVKKSGDDLRVRRG
jgi:hypothetical protein